MPSLNQALNIGARALSTQQRAMQTSGHNISNQNTEGFSRQQVSTKAAAPDPTGVGGGTDALPTGRVFDRFVQRKIVQENPKSEVFQSRGDFLNKLEVIFGDLGETGLRGILNEFWNSWSQLSSQPESEVARQRVQEQGDLVAVKVREMHAQLVSLRREADARIQDTAAQINSLGEQIAELNRQIFSYEVSGRQANDARDARELAVEELAKLVDVNLIENPNGRVSVIIGRDWTLVEGEKFFKTEATLKGGEIGMVGLEGVATNNNRRDITRIFRSGALSEMLQQRDVTIVEFMQDLDELAFGLANRINELHATGTGIRSAASLMKSTYGLNPEALNQPMPFLKDGVFQLHLVGQDDEFLETYEFEVQAGMDTLQDVVNRINQTVQDPSLLQANIEADGSMLIQTGPEYRFIFGEDQTDLTLIMGFNSFFESLKGAADLRVSDRILQNPNAISTGRDLIPGDNQVALAIAKLQTQPTMKNESMTFDEFYNGILGELGLRIRRNKVEQEQQDGMVRQFKEIRNSISGVNMDEELTHMVQYQKAYEASARFVKTVDEMMDTVINM
jgi:flagellar hook-associated protein 1 FlgK